MSLDRCRLVLLNADLMDIAKVPLISEYIGAYFPLGMALSAVRRVESFIIDW